MFQNIKLNKETEIVWTAYIDRIIWTLPLYPGCFTPISFLRSVQGATVSRGGGGSYVFVHDVFSDMGWNKTHLLPSSHTLSASFHTNHTEKWTRKVTEDQI